LVRIGSAADPEKQYEKERAGGIDRHNRQRKKERDAAKAAHAAKLNQVDPLYHIKKQWHALSPVQRAAFTAWFWEQLSPEQKAA
jgi:hypothetical protein